MNLSMTSTSARFPKISIPEFSGEVRDFLSFKNVFEDLVIRNGELSDIQRLHYLKSSLTGSAAITLKDFEFSEAAFTQARDHLVTRYENKRLIIASHFADLMSLPPVKSAKVFGSLLTK